MSVGLISSARRRGGGTEPPWTGAPGFIGNGVKVTSTSHVATIDVPYPADIQFHDILIIHMVVIETATGTPTFNAPAEWTVLDNGAIVITGSRQAIWWARANGSESGTVTLSFGAAGDGYQAVMSNFRGCLATGDPYESAAAATGTSSAPQPHDVTTTGANRLVCDMIGKQTAGSATSTPGSGWTEQYDLVLGGSSGSALVLDTKEQATAATVTGETTTSSASSRWRAVSFALLPR